MTLLSPPTGQSDWCLSCDFLQNQISKFSICDHVCCVFSCQYLYLARKTRLRGISHLVCCRVGVAQSGSSAPVFLCCSSVVIVICMN